MPDDFLQLASAFSRDFKDLRSMADRIAERLDSAEPISIEQAALEANRLINTRCSQGGSTMVFPPSKSVVNRERLSIALARLALHKIE